LREGAQDAHEAIRPTSVMRTPDSVEALLKRDELKLYRLIWERFTASQMAAAVFDQTTVEIRAEAPEGAVYGLRTTGSVLKFAGFTAVYEETRDEDVKEADAPESARGGKPRVLLPVLHGGDALDRGGIEPKQHFTEPPPRFTEAGLVRALEENGVGRPSTYSTIVETIQARGYVEQQERRFHPTEIGISVNDLLEEHFKEIMNLKYTASLEHKLDLVEERKEDWVKLLGDFYTPFQRELEEAERKLPKVEIKDEPTDQICENCGRPMVIKTGRFGRFISCTGYPECKTTKPILKETGALCPKDGGKVVERKSRKGRVFYGCGNYPACDFISWDRVAPDPCPVCGAYVTIKIKRKEPSFVCSANKEHEVKGPGAVDDLESDA
jgi:DNA topoisomerase-1